MALLTISAPTLHGERFMSIIESRHYHYHAISEGVFAAIAREGGGAFANSGIVDLGDQTLIFDTAITPTAAHDLVSAAKALTGRTRIDYVINSHYHRDHVRGNMVFAPETLIISNRETRNLLNSQGRQQLKSDLETVPGRLHELDRHYLRAYHYLPDCEQSDLQLMIGWHRAALDTLSRLKIRLPDITFDRRMVINGSRQRAVLIAVDGAHTTSDTLLYLPNCDVAFTGDLVAHQRHFWLGELSATALEDTLAFIETLGLKVVLPGHGPVLDHVPTAMILNYYQHLKGMVSQAAQSGISKDDFVTTPCPQAFANWHMKLVLYELNLGALYAACVRPPDPLTDTPLTEETDNV